MLRRRQILCSILGLAALFCLAPELSASRTTAIGLFSRRTDSAASREIILRFPIFLSKAFTRAQKGQIMYPNAFIKLREEFRIENRIRYSPDEYAQLEKALPDGNLVTAEIFEYQEKKKSDTESDENSEATAADDIPEKKLIFVRMHHYDIRLRKIVSFNVYSKPETVVLDMVRTLLPLENDRYLVRPILTGSKVAVVAPLEATALNDFYITLLSQKYSVHTLSGNEFASIQPGELEPLRSLISRKVSYESPVDLTPAYKPSLSAAADNEADFADFQELQFLYGRTVLNFDGELKNLLMKIRARTGADYLLILKPDGKTSFARGFDLNQGGMVWFQDSFPAKSASNSDILAAMVSEMQRPMVTLDEEQFEKIAQEKDKMTAQGAGGGLASVAILDFYDRTGTPLYAWLSSSLSLAVDDSMKKIFEYERADEKRSLDAGNRFFKSPADVTPARLKDFQAATGADYLIFGFYSLDTKSGNIVIESKIYDLTKKTAIGGSVTQSPVDVRLFNTVDEISQGIVQDIFAMTQSQNK